MLTAFFLLIAFALIISAPLLLVPILADYQQQSFLFTIYLCVCCVAAALFVLAAACSGNFYWYFDRRQGRISWFLHCGTGPFDYYWGKAFSKDQPENAPYTVHGVRLGTRISTLNGQPSNVSVVQLQPDSVAGPTAPPTIDMNTLKMLSMDRTAYTMVGPQFQADPTSYDPRMTQHTLDAVDAIQEEDEEEEEDEERSSNEMGNDESQKENAMIDKRRYEKKLEATSRASLRTNEEIDSISGKKDSKSLFDGERQEIRVQITNSSADSPAEPIDSPVIRVQTPPVD